MSAPDNPGNGSNQMTDGVQRPAIGAAGIGSDKRESFPLDTMSSETERLLDINGLLDMVKLISVVSKERRLGNVGRRSLDHVDE